MESKRGLLVLIAHERADRLAQVTAVVTGLGHEVIERKIGIIDVGQATIEARPDVAIVIVGHDSEPQALAVDRPDRERGGLSRHRDLGRAGSSVHQRSREAGHLRVHRGWPGPGGTAELDRHRAPAVRRVSRAGGRVRAARGDGAGEGHPDGAARDRRAGGVQHAPGACPPAQQEDGRGGGGGRLDPPAPPRAAGRPSRRRREIPD